MADPLDQLVAAVHASAKYRRVSEDFIRNLGARELDKRRNLKEAVKAVKNKLHQVGGAYLESKPDYAAWLDELRIAAKSPHPDDLRAACRRVMSRHASTAERLPILEEFYTVVLAGLPPIHSVLDVACGFNPLALPWMPLAAEAAYYACDIYTDMVDFINGFLGLLGVQGQAAACDAIHAPPSRKVDLALVLKTLPCLEQVDKSAGRLLENLNADHLLVSFPAQSLGGRDKGMVENYETRFMDLIAGKNWAVERFEFESELAFLVKKLHQQC